MISPSRLYPQKVDLNNCDKEPIHILGKIQHHGVLIAIHPDSLEIIQHSANVSSLLSRKFESFQGKHINTILSKEEISTVQDNLKSDKIKPLEVTLGSGSFTLIAHHNDDCIVLEFEPQKNGVDPLEFQQQLAEILSEISAVEDELTMCDAAARLIKKNLNYDRVMIYQFDEDWNGKVVSEVRESHLESWLGLHYPATDIPKQARALFLKQGVRIIADVNAEPVSIEPLVSPKNGKPLDLSKSELRAVSPIHIEYLKNMQVGATLTAAIVSNGTLWGLIACHHYSPKYINYYERNSCKFLTQVFAAQLVLRASNNLLQRANVSSEIRSKLIEQMSKDWNLHEGLSTGSYTLLDICDASGAAIVMNGIITLVGTSPSSTQVTDLLSWIIDNAEETVFFTKSISQRYQDAYDFRDVASGVLCSFISNNKNDAILWFKPELEQIIDWGGNPNKAKDENGEVSLSPRQSFDKWSETQKGVSAPWQDYEIASATALKENIAQIIVEKYREVSSLNDQLKKAYADLETFSYSVSHDLRAPLRGIDGFAQIIKEDHFESLDDFGKNALQTIISSTHKMNGLIDDILSFSGLSAEATKKVRFNVKELVLEVLELLSVSILYTETEIVLDDSLDIEEYGDRTMIFQLYNNLISNALKYSSKVDNPRVEVGVSQAEGGAYFVKDNGIGFNMNHAHKIYGVFSRLVTDEYEGSGIGLSIVKRVVEKHDGKIWVSSEPGKGTTFLFKFNT